MADQKSPAAAAPAAKPRDPFREYEEQFIASPDPWVEITKLDHGSERAFATTVQGMVINAEPAQRPVMEGRLLKALERPGCTAEGRMFICRMLALIGGGAAVPALASLLQDPATADAARYALEPNPDPAAAAALRAALPKLNGDAKIGLIGSIALRGDTAALNDLSAIQRNASEPEAVRAAAGRALERLNART